MLAMDQFKDIARLRALRVAPARRHGRRDRRLAGGGFDETLGGLIGRKLGPRRVRLDACDPELVGRRRTAPPSRMDLSADVLLGRVDQLDDRWQPVRRSSRGCVQSMQRP